MVIIEPEGQPAAGPAGDPRHRQSDFFLPVVKAGHGQQGPVADIAVDHLRPADVVKRLRKTFPRTPYLQVSLDCRIGEIVRDDPFIVGRPGNTGGLDIADQCFAVGIPDCLCLETWTQLQLSRKSVEDDSVDAQFPNNTVLGGAGKIARLGRDLFHSRFPSVRLKTFVFTITVFLWKSSVTYWKTAEKMIYYDIYESEYGIIVKTDRENIYAVEKLMIEKGYIVDRVINTTEYDLVFIEMYKQKKETNNESNND